MRLIRGTKASAGAIAAIASAALLLSGCAAGEERSAEPADSMSTPDDPGAVNGVNAETDGDFFLDTRFQFTNQTGKDQVIKLGAGCIDVSGLLAQTLVNGASVAVSGWCGFKDADVVGGFGVKVSSGVVVDNYSWYQITAANPKAGLPWINVDGVKHSFNPKESCSFTREGQIFEAVRRPDLPGSKDLQLTWVASTKLPSC